MHLSLVDLQQHATVPVINRSCRNMQSKGRFHTKAHYHEKSLSWSNPRHDMSSIDYDVTVRDIRITVASCVFNIQKTPATWHACAALYSLRAAVIY